MECGRSELSSDNISDIMQQTTTEDKGKDLIITEKGKLKWRGDLQRLQVFLDEVLNVKGKWSTASGAKILKTDAITIRWYNQNESLTIGGPDTEEVQRTLKSKAVYLTEVNPKSKQADCDENEGESDDESEPSNENINEAEYTGSLSSIVQGVKRELTDFKRQFDIYRSDTDKIIQNLEDKSVTGVTNEKENEIKMLREENYTLKQNNKNLNERIDNLAYILADLNGKIKTADEEKASLLTAIRLLQSDINITDSVETKNAWTKAENKGRNNKIHSYKSKSTKESLMQNNQPTKACLGSNRYLSLSIEEPQNIVDVSSDISTDDEESNERAAAAMLKKPQDLPRKQRKGSGKPVLPKGKASRQQSNGNSTANPASRYKTTVIVGDSMIKHLDPRRMQRSVKGGKSKIVSETYRGAKTDAMKHHIKPCLDKKPAQIILHVGTNDIPEKEPSKIVDGIKEICDIIQNDSPLTEIVISEIILRTDKPEYQQKVSETNSMLADFCESRNIYSISHNNIGKAHINPYGVHLNRAGTSALAKSILVFLNTDRNN
jgi:lysophospholipase L1-like esterase